MELLAPYFFSHTKSRWRGEAPFLLHTKSVYEAISRPHNIMDLHPDSDDDDDIVLLTLVIAIHYYTRRRTYQRRGWLHSGQVVICMRRNIATICGFVLTNKIIAGASILSRTPYLLVRR
jgi:hypothetical protein